MVNLNYQVFGKGFNLRLRFYKDGETRFIVVTRLLKGNLQKKHWNTNKQYFTSGAPYSEENNDTLARFKAKYEKIALEWEGSLATFMLEIKGGSSQTRFPDGHRFVNILDYVISEQKKKVRSDGTLKGTFEVYAKMGRMLERFCTATKVDYQSLYIEDFTPDFINSLFDWIQFKNNGKGYIYTSQMLHALLNRCDKMGLFNMRKVSLCRWGRKKFSSEYKYQTLSDEQCRRFVNMSLSELPKSKNARLFHDFCVFILYTCQSPCDAISLRYSDIKKVNGVDCFIYNRRKIAEKQSVSCCMPINEKMSEIMERWKHISKDGYVFPIRNKAKLSNQTTNNGDIKHLIGRLNCWLKKVGALLDLDFSLHAYTFRHTGITHYLSRNINHVYVANMVGTSVENCERIYYNNRGDEISQSKVLNAIDF